MKEITRECLHMVLHLHTHQLSEAYEGNNMTMFPFSRIIVPYLA